MSARQAIPRWAQTAWLVFADRVGEKPFRRQQLADHLNLSRRPRDFNEALHLADGFLRAAAKRGELVKAGHVHWALQRRAVRRLASGREVLAHPGDCELKVSTHVPEKYVLVDLETGDAWGGGARGWERATQVACREAKALLEGRGGGGQ